MRRRRGLAFVIFAVSMIGLGVLTPVGTSARAGTPPSSRMIALDEFRKPWVVKGEEAGVWGLRLPIDARADDYVAHPHLTGY